MPQDIPAERGPERLQGAHTVADTLRSRIAGRLPGIAWRDARLAERADQVAQLRSEVAAAEAMAQRRADELAEELRRTKSALKKANQALALADTKHPSFRRDLTNLRRTLTDLRTVDPDQHHPQRHIPFKLRNYRLAASHGVPTPTVYRSWASIADIDLAGLPDTFVLKSDGGAGGHGVLPLRRTGDDAYELLDGTQTFTEQGVRDRFAAVGTLSPPFFAEETLVQPGGGAIPDDVKIYAAYGNIMHTLLRRMPEHANLGTARYRYLDADAQDLGNVAPGQSIDPDIPHPEGLAEMMGYAVHLSRAAGISFVRVDLYATDRGPVLGEITRVPGGAQRYIAEHDERLGKIWETGRWELDLDLVAGRPFGVLHGTYPAPNLYPEGHISTREDPGSWAIQVVPCEQWCFARGGH